MAPDSVKVLEFEVSFVKVPDPEIIPEKVWAALEECLNVPLLVMLPAYDPDPNEPVPLITKVPAEMVVVPV
ncbi:hypothetical protein PHIN9_13230 [Polynucleobacter sp. HIN9]|nr:hypothetical protein PHIN9_13230 [Polynucleobacter sp. HIN9]